jgi:arylsulfatase A-like enzyme
VQRLLLVLALLASACGGGGGTPTPPPPPFSTRTIEIDIDDHGLAGLWMANAPNLKGLIARGTFAFSRVVVPTHSNQNNMAVITGQYPDGDNLPANAWLSRAQNFGPPINLPGVSIGDYTDYGRNPLLTRGDSVYHAVQRAGGRTAYFGQLPPFEAGADEVHLSIIGATFGTAKITAPFAMGLLTDILHYPQSVVAGYHLDGPPPAGESYLTFTLRNAAAFIRSTSATVPMPNYMFIWDFIAVDDDPTSTYGADGNAIVQVVEEYDAALGDVLAALREKSLLDSTNILFTLDHGKVDTHNQVAIGSHGQSTDSTTGATIPADGQLGALVAAQGASLGITPASYAILNEDGDAQIYARVDGAGTDAGAASQATVTHALLSLIQSGQILGLDITRTMTADGAMGTRTFHDFRGSSPNTADIVVFPADDWTLNQVDATNTRPGAFVDHAQFPYGRHGGFSDDELYVPLIMAGPAFKQGALVPHPIEHPDVAATAVAILGKPRLATAARGPIRAVLASDPTEAWPQPADMTTARAMVLDASGFGARPALAAPPATAAVIIDVAGLYDEEIFSDDALAAAAQPLRALAATGTRFSDFWCRSRDWPVTEYQQLAGGYPTGTPFFAAAEDDPAQTLPPGAGLLQMPVAAGFIANRPAYDAWRQPTGFGGDSIFDAAHAMGMTTALVGQADFHALHLASGSIDVTMPADIAGAAATVGDLLTQHPHALVVVALGDARSGDRHSPAAIAGLGTLASAVSAIAGAAGGSLIAITSRGATTIDDSMADAYGAGTSRHVPLILVGPNVRAGAISGQPATPADLPATILFGLGATVATDLANGTWAQGTAVAGVPQPTPRSASEGHALVRGFNVVGSP